MVKLALSYPEVCQNIPPLNIFSSQSDLSVSIILITLKVRKWDLKHTMFESFWSNLLHHRARYKCITKKTVCTSVHEQHMDTSQKTVCTSVHEQHMDTSQLSRM